MIVFDTSIISLVIDDSRSSLTYPKTKNPVERPGDRVRHLLSSLAKDKKTILLPAPVMAELLIYSEEKAEKLFRHLYSKNVFRIAVPVSIKRRFRRDGRPWILYRGARKATLSVPESRMQGFL